MSETKSITAVTNGQGKQLRRFAEDAVDGAIDDGLLDKDGAQNLIENGDEFKADIIASIKKHSLSNQYAHEEVESSYAYPKGYKVKGITEQTNILRQLFPGIGFADEKLAEQPLPPNAEGWFAIPKWQSVGKTYGEALQRVLDLIEQTRNGVFHNYCKGRLGANYLRKHERTQKKLEALGEAQKGYDILVVPAQFGLRHRGRSVRRAREIFLTNEFGLGSYEVGIMILTHPERLMNYDDLWIDCAGDEFAPFGGDFHDVPYFSFGGGFGGRVRFDTLWFDDANEFYGSASAFLPPDLL